MTMSCRHCAEKRNTLKKVYSNIFSTLFYGPSSTHTIVCLWPRRNFSAKLMCHSHVLHMRGELNISFRMLIFQGTRTFSIPSEFYYIDASRSFQSPLSQPIEWSVIHMAHVSHEPIKNKHFYSIFNVRMTMLEIFYCMYCIHSLKSHPLTRIH